MKVLLDTHCFLWAAQDSPDLSPAAREAITRDDSDVFISVATIWEIAIKREIGKLAFSQDLEATLSSSGYSLLAIEAKHALAAAALPPLHRDPFDRMLVAQSLLESLTLVTRDPVLPRYGIPCMLA